VIKLLVIPLLLLFLPIVAAAELVTTFDEPDTAYATNIVIDIIEHNGGVWFATGEGINYSIDNGQSWLLYNAANGLVSENISALFSLNGRLWIASNHEELIAGNSTTISDGLAYTDDEGRNWVQADFGDILYATGGDRVIFDITGYGNFLFASAFAGGLLASADEGSSWERIFPTRRDSVNYYEGHVGLDTLSLLNRHFSSTVDTSHLGSAATSDDDSLYVWVGTAGGLLQYVYVDPHIKPYSKKISSVAFCSDCSLSDTGFVYIGGENGITRGFKTGGPYITRFDDAELPYRQVTALTYYGGSLFAGLTDTSSGQTALAVSSDQGKTYTELLQPALGGSEVSEFTVINDRLYMAAGSAGLYFTEDTGQTWTQVITDNSYALYAVDDTLLVGTDSGLSFLYINATTGDYDSLYAHPFLENDSSSSRVIKVKVQEIVDTLGVVDSMAIWTVNRPVDVGTPMVGRVNFDSYRTASAWKNLQVDAITYDVGFVNNLALVVGEEGIRVSVNGGNPSLDYSVVELRDSVAVDSLGNDTVTVIAFDGDTLYFGTTNGFALSTDLGESFEIVRPVTGVLEAEFHLTYNVLNSFISTLDTAFAVGFGGNWVPAMGLQYQAPDPANIWISTRATGISGDTYGVGISRGDVDSLGRRHWLQFYNDDFAWNFAFNGDTVFAATNSGLIYTDSDQPFEWDTINFIDASGDPQVLPYVPIYGVEVIGNDLWVGTDDRTMRLSLSDLLVNRTFYVEDLSTSADDVYAFPVPYSHTRDYGLDFHFVVERDADVTLEIYDFNMDLVKRVIDNQPYPAGTYPTSGSQRRTWDGTNGKGEDAAVGVYYFKVEYSTGEVRWGKLAVMP